MDPKTDFVFYRDDKNNIYSGGYRINNLFKNLDVPPIYQKGGNSMVLPLGLFYRKENEEIYENDESDGGEITNELFNTLVKLSLKDNAKKKPKNKTRKRKK